MNALLKIVCIAGSVLLASCNIKPTAADLLKDKAMRADIMTAISNDSTMATEMLSKMSSGGATEKIMPLTCEMLGHIMANDALAKDTAIQDVVITGMMRWMKRDSVLCDKTCTEMSKNGIIFRMLRNTKSADTPALVHPTGRH